MFNISAIGEYVYMGKSTLVKWLGFPATLIHGDSLVLDRWMWLRKYLRVTKDHENLLDAGCGSGAFTLYAGKLGYQALGLSWDERNQAIANERAKICKVENRACFVIQDLRTLDQCVDYKEKFDFVISLENIEHILDDEKLIQDLAACLKPGGHLLLTTPNLYLREPHSSNYVAYKKTVEDGTHVRRGYSPAMMRELCEMSGLVCEEISYCSGFLSQKLSALQTTLCNINFWLGWCVTLPLRIFPPLLDRPVSWLLNWPYFSICMVAYKPRRRKHA